jgi:hypothetical protein
MDHWDMDELRRRNRGIPTRPATSDLLLAGKRCSRKLGKLQERLERIEQLLEEVLSQKILANHKLGLRNPTKKKCK